MLCVASRSTFPLSTRWSLTSVQFTDLMALLNKIWTHPQRGPKAEEALAPYLLSSLGIEHKPPRGKVPSRWLLLV